MTKTGYQSGAIEVARADGILLYEFREPTDADWDGRIKEVHLRMAFFVPHVTFKEFVLEDDWMQRTLEERGVKEFSFSLKGYDQDLWLYDQSHNPIESLREVSDRIIAKYGMQEVPREQVDVDLRDSERFIQTGQDAIPLAKLAAIKLEVSVGKIDQEIVIDGGDVVGFILQNVLSAEQTTFDKTLRLRGNAANN